MPGIREACSLPMHSLFGIPAGDRPLLALSLLLGGTFVIALQDALVKLVATETRCSVFRVARKGVRHLRPAGGSTH